MTSLKTFAFNARPVLGVAALGVLTIVIGWAALLQRGPDPAYLPQMADQPVTFADGRKIHVQRHEVTLSEWARCVAQGACSLELSPRPDQDPDKTPATGLSYVDVQEYVTWISKKSRHAFRLPTVEEWTYMAASVLPAKPEPLFTDPLLTWASTYLVEGLAPRGIKPQGSFSTSPEGIADLDGSVWEWTAECYARSADDANPERCPAYFVGGEHLSAMSYLIRDPARGGCAAGTPPAHLGMRLVTDESV